MNKKKSTPAPKTIKDLLFDALLGADEEMDETCADELLSVCGVNLTELVPEFTDRLSAEAQKIRLEKKRVPEPMRNALQSIRSAISTGQSLPSIEPHGWLENMLSGKLGTYTQPQPLYSFRKKKGTDIGSKDKEILDSLKARIEDKAKKG